MNQNPGLTSRFPETVTFRNMPPRHCKDLLLQCLQKNKLDITVLEASPTLDGKLLSLFGTLAQTPSWGNARDVQTLTKSIFSKIMKSKTPSPDRVVPEDVVLDVINAMVKERTGRAAAVDSNPLSLSTPPAQQQYAFRDPPPQISTTTTTETVSEKEDQKPPASDKDGPENPANKPSTASIRDAGVSDEVWEQLQRDKAAAEQRQRELALSRQKAAELERKVRQQEKELKRQKDEAKRREVLLKLEAARVERELAERKHREMEERARKEQAVKTKLKMMGLCPMGYEWIPQGGGYRCAGGSHFMSNEQLGI